MFFFVAQWTTPALGQPRPAWTAELTLRHASHVVPRGPSVVVHAPEGFDAEAPIAVVVFLHGWSCCAVSMVGDRPCGPGDPSRQGWSVGAHHDRSGVRSLLVTPQLAWLARDSSPGRFLEAGFFRGFLGELLGDALVTRLGRARRVDDLASVTLVAHSAGYQTALAILEHGQLDIRNVVLLDALYGGASRFASWLAAAPARKLVSVHTALRATTRGSRELAVLLRGRLEAGSVAQDPRGSLTDAVRHHRVVVLRSPHGHGALPSRHLADVLAGLL